MEVEGFARALSRRVRDEVVPLLGRPEARERAGTAPGGDPTYAIDRVGERIAEELFSERGNLAYFSEDAGLRVLGTPEALVLVDPIDGTRPALAGYETCCVSTAVAPFGTDLSVGDVSYGCVVEIKSGVLFEARRGEGARAEGAEVRPSSRTGPEGILWAGGFRGQPAVPTATVLAELFDTPGSEGAFFDQGSAAYSLSRLATGQLDAYVDPGQAVVEEVPGMEEEFRRVGGGHVLNTTTYDTAAGYLLLRELGLPLTDALGRDVDPIPLFDPDGRATLVSTVAACTPPLHARIVEIVRDGLERLRAG